MPLLRHLLPLAGSIRAHTRRRRRLCRGVCTGCRTRAWVDPRSFRCPPCAGEGRLP